jgi:hypothetical protein
MASRRAPGGRLSQHIFAAAPPPRRVLAAFALGASIATAGLALLAANEAAARGPFTAYDAAPMTRFTLLPLDPNAGPRRHRHHRQRIVLAKKGQRTAIPLVHDAVCVRLCDGYFFPLPAGGDAAVQASACNSLCPDAPTEVFYRSGSDRIEDSVSANGRRYSTLPVSLRYRSTSNNACSCHREAVAYAPLDDATLRRGDLIMTPAGFVMFRGAEGSKHNPDDFTALAKTELPAALRVDLQAMERVSLVKGHPSLRQWLASQASPALAERQPGIRIERVASRLASADDRIRLVVWRGGDRD